MLHRTPSTDSPPRFPKGGRRGFTLIELMVVVIIISVLAVIAIPAISRRMQDRRTQSAAQEISTIYRNARMRALGRGSAVMVRFDSAAQGSFVVREAVRGTANAAMNANCQNLPMASCRTADWTDVGSRLLSTYAPSTQYLTAGINIGMEAPTATAQTQIDVCFTPMGRAFVRYAPTALFTELAIVPIARVWRNDGGTVAGLERIVLIPPNGAARLGTSRERP